MHPHGGAISKHMAVGIQGKVSCQTTDLRSTTHTEQAFKGTLLAFKLTDFFLYISLFREGKLVSDLCQRGTSTLGI